jgi:hypothetical protein
MIEDKYYLPVEQRMLDRHDRQWDRLGTGRSEDLPGELRERQEQELKTLEERRMTLSLVEWLALYPVKSDSDLQKRVQILDEIIESRATERSAELKKDPMIDQEKVADVVRLELGELRFERETLLNELSAGRGVQHEPKKMHVNLEQELGLEIS